MRSTTTATTGETTEPTTLQRAEWEMELLCYELRNAEERGDLGHARRIRPRAHAATQAYFDAVFADDEVAA